MPVASVWVGEEDRRCSAIAAVCLMHKQQRRPNKEGLGDTSNLV